MDSLVEWQYLRDQIDRRMRDKGFTQKSLALAAGLHATAVRDILKGRSKKPESAKIVAIAAVLGCSVEELSVRPGAQIAVPHYGPVPARARYPKDGGKAHMEPLTESPSPTTDEPPAGMAQARAPNLTNLPHDIPVYGVTRGGAEGDGDFRFNGETVARTVRPPGLRDVFGAFCLFVQGDSMAPWRNEGDRVFINPARPPRQGDHVVVELKPEQDGEPGVAWLKRLVARSPDASLVLAQYNPPKDRIKVAGHKVLRVFRVMEWEELLMG